VKIRAIAPILLPQDELLRRRDRYAAISPPNVSIHLDNLTAGPQRLESDEQIRRSENLVFGEAMRTDPERFDAVLLDCVLDPALERLQTALPLPVFGITHLVSNYLGSLNLRMAAVARNKAIADEIADRIDSFGWSSHLEKVIVLDLSLKDIGDTDLWNETVAERVGSGELESIDVVINGCSAVEVRPIGGPRVIDPTALALALIGVGADLLAGDSS